MPGGELVRFLSSPARLWSALFLVWLALLAGGVALAVLAAREPRLPGDLSLARTVQGWPFPGDALSEVVRAVTGTEVVIAMGVALSGGLWIAGARYQAAALVLGLAVLPLTQHGLKELVDRPRPTADLVELRAGFSSRSFPSGHVMSAVLLYGFVLYSCLRLALPRGLPLAAALLSTATLALAGPVNVYLGVHWPSDTVGGYVWGLVLLLPIAGLGEWLRCRPET